MLRLVRPALQKLLPPGPVAFTDRIELLSNAPGSRDIRRQAGAGSQIRCSWSRPFAWHSVALLRHDSHCSIGNEDQLEFASLAEETKRRPTPYGGFPAAICCCTSNLRLRLRWLLIGEVHLVVSIKDREVMP